MVDQEHAPVGAATEAAPFRLTLETFMPEMLQRHPQTREVLNKYGLRGCGGPEGPHESVGFFARAHGVDESRLMDELRVAITQTPTAAGLRAHRPAAGSMTDRIYRPFFLAGIATVLSIGVVWGLVLLWQIGIDGAFSAASILEINAHGHAMIFGWMGLFIMGFALQALPRFWHVELPGPKLAVVGFVAMAAGVVIRTVAMGLPGFSWAAPVALGGGLLELAAILVAAFLLVGAFARKEIRTEPYMIFVLVALGWFILQSAYGLWHVWGTMLAVDRNHLILLVSTYQAPLRDMQVHGLALFMILGVSMRILPPLYGQASISNRRAWIGLGLLIAAVLGEIVFFIAFRWTDAHPFMMGVYLSWILLAAGVATIVWPWKFWRADSMATHDRTGKFIRIAYGWLGLSLLGLLLLPLYQWALGAPFSHAYYGAIRHAVTVGFVSMMIVGVASRVVPTLRGRDPQTLSNLWGPFILLNLGCFLRVSLQTLTDWTPAAYPLIGLSGTLELIALAWWGIGLALMMTMPARPQTTGDIDNDECACEPDASAPAPASLAILPTHKVGEVLDRYPQALEVFVRFGYDALKNPVTRRMMANRVTIAQAAQAKGIMLEELLLRLNEVV